MTTSPFAVGARTWRARSRKWLITGFLYIPAGAPRRRPYNTIHGIPTSGPWATSQTAFGGQLPYEGSLGRPAVNNGENTCQVNVAWFCDRRFRYKAFHGIPTTGRPLAGPYSDICDVAAACVKDFKKILDNSFTQ